jgi:hypothetical protein
MEGAYLSEFIFTLLRRIWYGLDVFENLGEAQDK